MTSKELVDIIGEANEDVWSLIARGVLREVDTVLEELPTIAYDYFAEEVGESVENWPSSPQERRVWIYRKLRTFLNLLVAEMEGK